MNMTTFVERKPLNCTIYESHCSMYKTRGGKKKGITYDCKAIAWEQSCV